MLVIVIILRNIDDINRFNISRSFLATCYKNKKIHPFLSVINIYMLRLTIITE